MIQILTVKDYKHRQLMCQKAGIALSDDLHIIALSSDCDALYQGAIFRYSDKFGEILWLDMGNDLELADGLARSVLSIMEIRGVKEVSLPLHFDSLANKLQFKKDKDRYYVLLDNFFCTGCQHKHI